MMNGGGGFYDFTFKRSIGYARNHAIPERQRPAFRLGNCGRNRNLAGGVPALGLTRRSITDLSARGEISKCSVTRFNNGEKVEAVLCRVAGYIPPKSPGRKPGASS